MGKGTLTLRNPVDAQRLQAQPIPITPRDADEQGRTNICYILIGLPGAGKSYWVDSVLRHAKGGYPALICEDEIILAQMRKSGEDFNTVYGRISRAERKRECLTMFNAALGVRRNIIIDRPNLTEVEREEYLSLLPDSYQKVGIMFTCPIVLVMDRLTRRFEETGRPFSQAVIQNMHRGFEKPGRLEFDRVTTIDHLTQYI